MKAKEQAKQAKAQEKIQQPVHAPGQNDAAGAGDKVPIAEVEKAAIPPVTAQREREEKERKEAEAKTELNAILKRAPSMFLFRSPLFISCP